MEGQRSVARYADLLSEQEQCVMRALFRRLVASKPRGWSVVVGDRELVVRPANRLLGKVGITIVRTKPEPAFCVSFFSPAVNRWSGSAYFPLSADSAGLLLDWAIARVATEGEAQQQAL